MRIQKKIIGFEIKHGDIDLNHDNFLLLKTPLIQLQTREINIYSI